MTLELSRISACGVAGSQVGVSRTQNNIYLARKNTPLGEVWVKQPEADSSLETLLVRPVLSFVL